MLEKSLDPKQRELMSLICALFRLNKSKINIICQLLLCARALSDVVSGRKTSSRYWEGIDLFEGRLKCGTLFGGGLLGANKVPYQQGKKRSIVYK